MKLQPQQQVWESICTRGTDGGRVCIHKPAMETTMELPAASESVGVEHTHWSKSKEMAQTCTNESWGVQMRAGSMNKGWKAQRGKYISIQILIIYVL